MKRVRALVCAWVIGLLAACGGGGGDEGGFSVSFDRSSVSMSYAVGSTVVPATLMATANGTPPGQILVGATTPSGQPDPNIQQVVVTVVTDRSASVQIQPNPSLGVGSYRGTLLLQACPDSTCSKHYDGSPFSLSYTITVTPGITLEPSNVVLEADVGHSASQFVKVSLPPLVSAAYTATSIGGVVTVDQLGPTGFRVTGQASLPGVQADVIRVRAGEIIALLQVQYTSREITLRLDRASLAFTVGSGASTGATADIAVTQLPPEVSTFSVDASSLPWLSAEQTPTGARVSVSSALHSGAYTGSVTVRAGSVAVSVPVNLTVTAPEGGDRNLSTAVSQLTFAAAQGMASAGQTVGLVRPSWNNRVDVAISYGGTSRDWLHVTTLPNGDLEFNANALGLPAVRHDATVTLTGAEPSTPITLPVTFNVGRGLAFPAPQFVLFNSATPSRLSGSFPVTAEGPSTFSWRITACSWLHPTRSTGVLGTTFEYEVDVDALRALPPDADMKCELVVVVVDQPPLPPGGTPIAPMQVVIIAQRTPNP